MQTFGLQEAADFLLMNKEVFSAGFACGLALDEIADRYVGSYSSNVDFAEQWAEDTGSINTSLAWPYTCINWEWAANDLMMDHDSFAGHYFFRS